MTQAQQLLAIGTQVRVKGILGKIVRSSLVSAHNGGLIALNEIRFTHRQYRIGNVTRFKAIEPVIKSVNYSFIEVLYIPGP